MDVTEEFQETYNQFLFKKAERFNVPMMGTFELTPICNMSCKMCYIQQNVKCVNQNGGLKDIDFWKRIFDEAVEAGMLFCLLTGGEIFTYPQFREIYEYLCKKGVHIVLNTNGTMLDFENVSWLAQHPPRRVNISLYGASSSTYDKLCNYSAGFEKVIHAFELLNQFKIPFRVHGVMVPSNIDDYEGMKEICNQFRVPMELSFYMFPPIRKDLSLIEIEERFSPEQMAWVAFQYRKDQCGGDGERWNHFLEEKCKYMEHPEQMRHYGVNKITCRSGSCVFWVNWKGLISGCGMEDYRKYNLDKISFSEAWNFIAEDVKTISTSKKCSICEYRSICPYCAAAAYCETGKIDGTPEYLCKYCEAFSVLLKDEWKRKNMES